MNRTILRIYSAWFRYGGLGIATLSVVASATFAYFAIDKGFVLINGVPRYELLAILRVVATPLPVGFIGLALYLFVPKVPKKQ